MFTGIIQHVGWVESVQSSAAGMRIAIDPGPLLQGLAVGDSLAVAGACLTVSEIRGPLGLFDVVRQTLERTTLGFLKPSARVNLERAVSLGGRLEGHIVQGHVDGLAELAEQGSPAGGLWRFACCEDLTSQMVEKGSIAVDGVSLTLAEVSDNSFSVALIPHTLEHTTLGPLKPSQKVNVETDIIGKYVLSYLRRQAGACKSSGLTKETLRRAGFID